MPSKRALVIQKMQEISEMGIVDEEVASTEIELSAEELSLQYFPQ